MITLASCTRTVASTSIAWRAWWNTDECPEFLIPWVWGGAQEFALLTSSQVRLVLLILVAHLENFRFRQFLHFTIKGIGMETLAD